MIINEGTSVAFEVSAGAMHSLSKISHYDHNNTNHRAGMAENKTKNLSSFILAQVNKVVKTDKERSKEAMQTSRRGDDITDE
jgi:hypothetical protein